MWIHGTVEVQIAEDRSADSQNYGSANCRSEDFGVQNCRIPAPVEREIVVY